MREGRKPTDLTPLDVIRVETALSRYPTHRLAKGGLADIELHETTADGELTLLWQVSHNSRFGQPGPLAYKVDTLVVNRRIEAAGRPAPRLLRLGSLREIAEMVGVGLKNGHRVKQALYQNASAFIQAKIRYRSADGAQRSMEIGATRYMVVFTGETLPDGRRADCVHLVLQDFYREILDTAIVRPLDYEYLRTLNPAPQRWYELASYQVYAAVKNGRTRARLGYADFCRHAPQTRHPDWDLVRRQMANVHAPHLASGYITGVEFEPASSGDGRPDWTMVYTLGPKALGPALGGQGGPPLALPGPPAETPLEPAPVGPAAELVARGITPATAAKLAEAHPADRIAAQLDAFDFLVARKDKALKRNPAGYLHRAIADDFAPPPGFVPRAERERRQEAARALQRGDAEAVQARAAVREAEARIRDHWAALTPEDRTRVEAEAMAAADPEARAACVEGPPMLRRLALAAARDAYLRGILGLPPLA